jgi:hypothetical protein
VYSAQRLARRFGCSPAQSGHSKGTSRSTMYPGVRHGLGIIRLPSVSSTDASSALTPLKCCEIHQKRRAKCRPLRCRRRRPPGLGRKMVNSPAGNKAMWAIATLDAIVARAEIHRTPEAPTPTGDPATHNLPQPQNYGRRCAKQRQAQWPGVLCTAPSGCGSALPGLSLSVDPCRDTRTSHDATQPKPGCKLACNFAPSQGQRSVAA